MDIEEIKDRVRANQYVYSALQSLLTPGREEFEEMRKVRCNFCNSDRYEERRIEYLYSHDGNYLIVPNTPVEVCLNCGMIYYDAAVLKEIERRFFAIQNKTEEPDRYVEVPAKAFT
jgi:YgiT-type zinc finger domain-containing protein